MDTETITSGDIAAEIKAQSAPASPAAQPAAAAEPAAPAIEAPAPTDEHGPIPFERHEAILGKTRREYDDRISRLSWAEGLTPAEVREALALRDVYRTKPERLAEHLAERVKGPAAEPQPDVKDEHGQPFYSPQQAAKWAAWQAEQIVSVRMAELEERFGPIESEFTQGQQMRALNAQVSDAEQWPGFLDHVTEITDALNDVNDRRARGERIPKLTLHEAYIRIVAPKLATRSAEQQANDKKAWLAELNSTTERVQDDVKPNRAPAASRKRDEEKTTAEMFHEEVAAARAR